MEMDKKKTEKKQSMWKRVCGNDSDSVNLGHTDYVTS